MNVRKRSGKVVPFDAEFIRRAVTLAAVAAGEHDPDAVDRVTEAVQAKLEAAGQETVDIVPHACRSLSGGSPCVRPAEVDSITGRCVFP